MTKLIFITLALLIISISTFAAETKIKISAARAEAPSVRAQAVSENASIDQKAYKKSIQASEAQDAHVESFLKLQDPTPELRNRPWLWTFAFTLQNFKPMGTGKVSNSVFNLQDYGSSVMPTFELGFTNTIFSQGSLTWSSGMAARAGYLAQKTNLITPSGYTFDRARLNTALLGIAITNRLFFDRMTNWSFLLSPAYGLVSYTQTAASNTQANFTQQNPYWGLNLGVEYAFSKKWGILAQYGYRQVDSKNSDISDLQKNSFELGTSVLW